MKIFTQNQEIDLGQNVTKCYELESNPNIPDVFSMNVGYTPSQGSTRYLDKWDFRVAQAFVLSNYDILKPYQWCASLTCLNRYRIHNLNF